MHKVVFPSQKEACYRGGLINHKANDRRLKEATCHGCGKKGGYGCAVSLISYKLKQVLPPVKIRKTTIVLRTYTSEVIPVRGEVQVNVTYGEQKLTLYVTKQEGPSLLGREWLTSIRLDWKMIGLDKVQRRLHEMLNRYSEVFQDDLGTMKEIKAELKLKENASPKFHHPRTVPFALKGAVEQELTLLEDKGILKVSHSIWAAPIVPVPKKDGKVRVCGDYKVTVNPCLDVDQYPLPNRRSISDTSKRQDLL